jgi:hypothetical protein
MLMGLEEFFERCLFPVVLLMMNEEVLIDENIEEG